MAYFCILEDPAALASPKPSKTSAGPSTSRDHHQGNARHDRCCDFMPKYPVKNVKGRKNVDTMVSCRTLSFCLAVMRLNIRDVRFSAERMSACVVVVRVVIWSCTSDSARTNRSAHCVYVTQRSDDCTNRGIHQHLLLKLTKSIAEIFPDGHVVGSQEE
ncbi:hypothetical protein KC349_g297 [Hortaea werneckii]|nr:hypothetical protein KC349_g297 [Hortaea werneckii]